MTDIRHAIYGLDFGFNPGDDSLTIAENLIGIRKELHLGYICAPSCGLTAEIVDFDEDFIPITGVFLRSSKIADGGFVSDSFTGIAFFNADSPIIAVYDESLGRLAVLSGEFRCLVPVKRGKIRDKGIIEELFENKGFSTRDSKVWFGCGAGPCCYTFVDFDDETKDYSLNLPVTFTTRNDPGKQSIDIYKLIWNLLLKTGVPPENISADFTCTACAGLPQSPKYYSMARSKNRKALKRRSNVSVAWLA